MQDSAPLSVSCSFQQAYKRLCDPELICLKRDIAVSKGQTVECMTVRHFSENNTQKVEVWVGSGQSDNLSAQVTIIDLSDMGVEVNKFLVRSKGSTPLGLNTVSIAWPIGSISNTRISDEGYFYMWVLFQKYSYLEIASFGDAKSDN